MPAADARRVRAAPRRCEQAEHNLLAAPLTSRLDLRGEALRRKARGAMTSRLDRAA
jgi:hypothetical protein